MSPRPSSRLAPYERKRNFRRTSEPRGRTAGKRGHRFCVHKHAARRLHYDLRLEIEGALESWAVPKGPSLDPAQRRLAVHVEPHPLEYGDFEGVIPEGEYGDGAVMLWDEGTWHPEGDARKGLAAGKLSFRLQGHKLNGAWTLVRMRGGQNGKDEDAWLLLKQEDEHADGEGDVTALSRSAKTERTLEEIARAERAKKAQESRARRADQSAEGSPPKARRATRTRKAKAAQPVEGARKAPLPKFVAPQLARLVKEAPQGAEWRHEIKYDGYRMLVRRDGADVRIHSRNENDWTERLPWLRDAVLALPEQRLLLDGEVAHVDARGRTHFGRLKQAFGDGSEKGLRYLAFDLLHMGQHDLRACPLSERQRRLAEVLDDADPILVASASSTGRGPEAFKKACAGGYEGIVSKRANAPYSSGRGPDWRKVKCLARQEFVVVGWTSPSAGGEAFGSLLLAVYEGRRLVYAGRVGTGFTSEVRGRLRSALRSRAIDDTPLEESPPPMPGGKVHWVRPDLVAEVAFTEWTADGRLRHPSFQGLREDKRADEVVRESPVDVEAEVATYEREEPAGIRITNPERVLFPDVGVTKRSLAEWYVGIADRMLPFVAERPLALVRCPEGVGDECFFQKHRMSGWPEAIRTQQIESGGKKSEVLFVSDAAGLVALVQMGTLEVHVQGVRIDRPDLAERIVFDLDPAPDVEFSLVIDLARRLRDALAAMDLDSHPLATGGKGLHIVVPLERRRPVAEVKAFSKKVAQHLVREDPEHVVAESSKAKREGKVFVDYLRNGRGATAICPYSTRARAGAPVATPLRWDELRPSLRPDGYTLSNINRRLARLSRDPWSTERTP